MNITEQLTNFNLTKQEAIIYITLTRNGSMTGYEVAKETGISRSNVYTALASLVEKGAAYLIEDTAKRYTSVNITDFCNNKIRKLKDIREKLIARMPDRKQEGKGYITIKGKDNILDKMKNMIIKSKKRIYISLSKQTLKTVLPQLKQAINKNLKVVIITKAPFELEGAIVYHSEKKKYQIRLIVDSTKVLTGEILDENNSTCLYSNKKNLVSLFKESLKNEIKLIELTNHEGNDN